MPLALIVIGAVFGVIMILVGFYLQAVRNREKRESHGQY
jgi:hypothetical protein